MTAELEKQKNVMTYDQAITIFGEPVKDRETPFVKALAWHQGSGWTFNWDLFIPKGSKVTQHDFSLAMAFTKDGLMQEFEIERTSNPQSMLGATTEHAVQAMAMYAAINYIVVPALNRVVDN